MNLLLLTPEDHAAEQIYRVDDARAVHMQEVLRAEVGDEVRAGLLDGPRGRARVESIGPEGVTVRFVSDELIPPAPKLDLLLALPRPRSLKKLLPEVTALGAGQIVLTETHRVEKAFFGATLLRPEVHRPLLLEGLMQAKLTRLPRLTVERKLWRVLESLDERFGDHLRLVAHPDASARLADVKIPRERPVLLAIGPEGGFLDKEVLRLEQAGFQSVTMGEKTLRVETACVGLLAQIDLLRAQSE